MAGRRSIWPQSRRLFLADGGDSLMSVLALGVSYRRAPVELLEQLSFTEEDYPTAYRQLKELAEVQEAVIVSTCNRVEVFAEVASYHAGFLALKRFLCDSRKVNAEAFAEPLYSHYEDDAAEHLLSVASGIDSMVLGEPQILTQVREAFRRAEAEEATGSMLSSLFRAAIRTGRRVRAETAIGASPATFVEAGTMLAEQELGGLAGRSAVVVGAGGMASLAVKHLRGREVGQLRVVNRSLDRARRLAARAGGEPYGLDALVAALAHADLVVTSTGAAGTVIGPDAVGEALASNGRGRRPLFLLDLAVPRDVDPAVKEFPGVRLADIDDLQEILAESGAAPGDLDRARAIVLEEVGRFAAWRRAARLAPLIQALRERGARIEAAELARASSRLSSLSDRDWAAIESLASSIVAKLLHQPIVRLKERSGPGTGDELARAAAELFGLDFDPRA
jgi:glutamyl-tRNA reductase